MKIRTINASIMLIFKQGILLLTLILGTFFFACDKIEPPYAETAPLIPTDTNSQIVMKNFLIEDYTGHKCPNCPTAAKVGDSLYNIYKNRIKLLSVHAGYYSSFGTTGPYSYNFRTTVGTELHNAFGITAYPTGLINRKLYGGNRFVDYTDWGKTIINQLQTLSEVDIKMQINYDSTLNTGNIKIDNKFLVPQNRVLKLSVFITEDSIINWQKNNNPAIGAVPDIEFYCHMHVLRGSLNGTYGDTIVNSNISQYQIVSKTYPLQLNSNWKKKHCAVLAFVMDANTLEIIQVENKKIIP